VREGFHHALHARRSRHPAQPADPRRRLQKAITGYEFWFHREPDYRLFAKG
jgi:hypothetical protein